MHSFPKAPLHCLINQRAHRLEVDILKQSMYLLDAQGQLIKTYPISTAKKGAGEQFGSYQTPRGWHVIRAKIGDKAPLGSIFVARRSKGEIYHPDMKLQFPERDWILTRILWLCGCEPAKNRFGSVDTMKRYIYIHGVPDEASFETPRSKGCINMYNQDIVELFDLIEPGAAVWIHE